MPNGCWEWQFAINIDGYGVLTVGSRKDKTRKTVYAHRYSYKLFVDPDIDDFYILHHCDNPKCVRPSHLYKGTQLENMQDASNRGRLKPWDRSERNPSAKLNKKQVEEIYLSSKSIQELAKDYSVNYETIRKIVNNISWISVTSKL